MGENQFSSQIKIFQLDGRGEFIKTEFIEYLKTCDISDQSSYPRIPQQNGVFERKHPYIVERGLTLLVPCSYS